MYLIEVIAMNNLKLKIPLILKFITEIPQNTTSKHE